MPERTKDRPNGRDQKQITFTIDGRTVTAPAGTLVIEAAKTQGIEVPSFCYYPGLSLQAACRMCLVEVEKMPKLQTACTLVATDGMVVRTDTEQVHKARKDMMEFLLSNHPLDCPVCDKGGECELQDMIFRYGVDKTRFVEEKLHTPEEKWSPLVYYDAPRCILCFRCVRVCDEGMDVKALGVGARGVQSVIMPNEPDELACEECGMCIDICPVGALTSGTYRYQTRPWEMTYVATPARTARTAARPRSACATTKFCAPIIAIIPASTAIFSAPRAASDSISRRIPSACASRWCAATASSSLRAGKMRSRKSRAG